MNILNQYQLYEYMTNYNTLFEDKKQKGAVFTNIKLINTMLDKLPKNVWKNPNFKWLDPAAGIGNFHIIIYYRLLKSLTIIKDIEKRRKHIIENMLYFIELDPKYVDEINKIFCSTKYNLNIFTGSFFYLHTLEEDISIYENNFHILFDLIVGNPPYQKINMKNKNKLSAKPLYHLFVEYSIKYLKEDGLLLFIHPVSWRRKSKEIRIIHDILKKKLIYIYTNNQFKDFNISAPFINYYLLQNTLYNKNHQTNYDTIFNGIKYSGKLHLKQNLEYIPVFLTENTMSIFDKICNKNDNNFDVQLESKLSTEKKNISKYRCEEFRYLNLHTYSKKNGYIYRYSNKKHPCQDKLKILMIFKGGYNYLNPFIDNGTMGITDNSMRLYINDDNKDIILDFLKSKLFKFLLMATTYNYGANQKNEFHIINTFSIPLHINYNEFYNLNTNDINFIESVI